MDQRAVDGARKRPIRAKRHNRRNFGEERRPPKRLFTPEIKRFLKGWLVRRRDNPYPNRDEKKALALQTGLTYIQVCNWFANWRRKLKNAGKEPQRKTWGYLIKTYNSQVQGNVEHFSICSDDSIWDDDHQHRETIGIDAERYEDFVRRNSDFCENNLIDHCYTIEESPPFNNNNINIQHPQCFYISSTTENEVDTNSIPQAHNNKYKSHIMEKYLRDCQKVDNNSVMDSYDEETAKPSIMSKWRQSAANFRPSEKNYLHWTLTNKKNQRKKKKPVNYQQHGREELDAAETLTRLANAYQNATFAINV